jgi:hypothetical protein
MLPTFYLFSGDDGMDPRLVPAVPAARYTPPITLLSLFKNKYNTTMYIFTLLYKMRYIHELFDFSFLQVKTRKELSGVKM